MKIPKKLTKCLVGQIDFSTFHVLDVTPNKAHGSVVFLLPKESSSHTYYGMSVGERAYWYGTVERMLDEAIRCNYIGRVKRAVLLLRARRIYKKHNISGGKTK